MVLRGLAIWSGVGLGHLAVLGALMSGPRAEPRGGSLVEVELFAAELPSAPVAATFPEPPVAASPRVPVGAATRMSSAGPTSPGRDPAPAGAAETVPGPATPPRADAAAPALPPRFVHRVEPVYPARALRAGVEGSVTLRLRLSSGGRLLAAEVRSGSGSAALDEAALEAARGSRYAPAVVDGVPAASETEATYRFELR